MKKWNLNDWLILFFLALPCACHANARVTLEAESAVTVDAPMVTVREGVLPEGVKHVKGASGDAYLEIPEGKGNPPDNPNGKAVLKVTVPADGNYTLWCRVWWEGECSNSFNVTLNDEPPFLFGENATYKAWHWVRYPVSRTAKPISLKAGELSLSILNREDGIRLDQVVLSADKRFVPVDVEPVGVKEK